jgi:hypothetical protein
LVLVSVFTLGLAAIFIVPFWIPVHDGISVSYIFGFNNKAAIALLLLFALAFGLWSRGLGLALPNPAASVDRPFQITGRIAVALTLVTCLLVWWASQAAVSREGVYFLDRLEMFRMGGRVYRDFIFDYGPLMFYLPVWISRITGASLPNGYFLAWTVQWVFGTWALWKIVAATARGTEHGRTIFLLFWAFWLSALLDCGTNYTPFRFCGSLIAALAVERLYSNCRSLLPAFGTAIGAAVFLVFFSPEQGIGFSIGTIGFFLLGARCWRPGTLPLLALFTLASATAVAVAIRLGALDSVFVFGGGALDFPVLPTIQTVVLISLLVIAGCVAIRALLAGEPLRPLVYLVCVAVPALPAAFGRADVGHIVINSEGALIAALVGLSQYPKVWRWAALSFAVVVLLAWHGHPTFQNFVAKVAAATSIQDGSSPIARFAATFADASLPGRIEQFRAWKSVQSNPQSPKLPSRTKLLAPLGFRLRIAPLPGDPQIWSGKYAGILPYAGTRQLFEKIAELRSNPDTPLILPATLGCQSQSSEMIGSLQSLLVAPWMPPLRNTGLTGIALCDFILTAYTVSDYAPPVPGYRISVRKERY